MSWSDFLGIYLPESQLGIVTLYTDSKFCEIEVDDVEGLLLHLESVGANWYQGPQEDAVSELVRLRDIRASGSWPKTTPMHPQWAE
jgi:hypothetical protein